MIQRAVLAAVVAGLAGCGDSANESIEKWMADVSKDMRGRVTKVEEPKKFVPYKYEIDKQLDPFNPQKVTALIDEARKAPSATAGPRPDLSRRKEVLESFPLENLKMVGMLQQKGAYFAIIRADQNLHRVRVGNYLGQNFGKITGITETEVTLQEMIEDGSGEYVYRDSTLVLQEEKK
jgi:type IV pilus assembly protein PilP